MTVVKTEQSQVFACDIYRHPPPARVIANGAEINMGREWNDTTQIVVDLLAVLLMLVIR